MEQRRRSHLLYNENGTKRPIVNIILVVVNVLVWCIMELSGDTLDGAYIISYGGLYPDLVLESHEWYRLITAMFLHFGPQHLANNMILLAAAGYRLEQATGHLKYLIIYLVSGVAGSLLSLYIMVATDDYAVCAGASGAIFGMTGALVWVAVRNRGRIGELTTKGLLIMIALCLYNGFTSTGIDNWAHIGGAAGGFILSILLYRKPQET